MTITSSSTSGVDTMPIDANPLDTNQEESVHVLTIGIVGSKKIFATDLRYLNDWKELIHIRTILDQVIEQSDEITRTAGIEKANLKDVVARMFRAKLSSKTEEGQGALRSHAVGVGRGSSAIPCGDRRRSNLSAKPGRQEGTA